VLNINFVDAEIIKDGTSYLVSDNTLTGTSLEVLSFIVGGIEQSQNFNDGIDGRSRLFQGSEEKYRKITLNVRANAEYLQRVAHLRDAANDLFSGEYYIREMRIKAAEVKYESPGERTGNMDLGASEYVNGKQFKVTKVSAIETDDLLQSNFTIELETTDLPYAESIYTTKELNDSGYDATVAKYGLVDNIDTNQTQYEFTTSEFSIWNAGNVTIEPEFMYLIIRLNYAHGTNGVSIKNLTTGESFILNKAVSGSHVVLNGMDIRHGALNALRDSNRQRIRLLPGRNDFEIVADRFDVARVETRFYYK